MGYLNQTVKGVSWMGSLRAAIRSITFIRLAILARILTPSQFGVFGITTIILSFIEIITETGINVFLVQEKGEINKYLNTAWVISIIRGTIIALLIASLAKLVAIFFNSPDSYSLVLLISIVPFLRGFINPSIVKFQKDLQFHREFFYRSSIFLIDTIFSISFVFLIRQPISLVYGLIASTVYEVIISFIVIKPTPSFNIQTENVKKIIARGKWITAYGIFDYLFTNLDNIVVGRFVGTTALGLYQMGYKFSTLPITEISDVISKVAFPIFVKISDDQSRLKKSFLKTTLVLFLITLPFGLILFFYAKEIISILLGNQWVSIVPVVKLLLIYGIIKSVSGTTSSLFLAKGKQEYITLVTLAGFLGLAIPIIPLVLHFGIIGAGISVIIGSAVTLPVIGIFVSKTFRKLDQR